MVAAQGQGMATTRWTCQSISPTTVRRMTGRNGGRQRVVVLVGIHREVIGITPGVSVPRHRLLAGVVWCHGERVATASQGGALVGVDVDVVERRLVRAYPLDLHHLTDLVADLVTWVELPGLGIELSRDLPRPAVHTGFVASLPWIRAHATDSDAHDVLLLGPRGCLHLFLAPKDRITGRRYAKGRPPLRSEGRPWRQTRIRTGRRRRTARPSSWVRRCRRPPGASASGTRRRTPWCPGRRRRPHHRSS